MDSCTPTKNLIYNALCALAPPMPQNIQRNLSCPKKPREYGGQSHRFSSAIKESQTGISRRTEKFTVDFTHRFHCRPDFSARDRGAFLDAFFDAYRSDSSRIFLAFSRQKEKRPVCSGGTIGRISTRNRDLVEVRFLNGDRATRLSLLSHIEYQASKEGVRWVGVKTRTKSIAGRLREQDYKIAHMPNWWTLYYLEKELSGGLNVV